MCLQLFLRVATGSIRFFCISVEFFRWYAFHEFQKYQLLWIFVVILCILYIHILISAWVHGLCESPPGG